MRESVEHTAGILDELAAGRRDRADELARMVYDNLKRYAAAVMGGPRGPGGGAGDRTLQPTALVNEAYLRMVDQSRVSWEGRTHFFAVGAEMIRRVLVDDSRRRGAAKRGGGWGRVAMEGEAALESGTDVDVVALDEALKKLAGLDPRAARVVELKFFGGLREQDVAALLEVSPSTVRDDWKMARVWLREAMREAGDAGA